MTFDLSFSCLPEILLAFSLSDADLPELIRGQKSLQLRCSQTKSMAPFFLCGLSLHGC